MVPKMEFRISQENFVQVLALTQNIVERRTTMPILANVLLSVSKGTLRVSATDLETTAVSETKAEAVSTGSTTVSAKMLHEIVRELPPGDVHVKLGDAERLEITSGNTKMRIVGVTAEEFPALPGIDHAVKSKISSKQLLGMINKTLYAVSTDETRFNLCGVYFEFVGSDKDKSRELRFTSTDGHRIASATRPAETIRFEKDVSVLIPRKGLAELRRLLDGEDRLIGIDVVEGFFIVEADKTKIAMRLIDAEFPDYKQAIPGKPGEVALVRTEEFTHALKRAALVVSDRGKGVRLDFSENKLDISGSSPERGDAKESFDIEFKGQPVTLGFSAKYLQEFLATVEDGQNVSIELHGAEGPARLRSEADESDFSVLMPMRL